MKRWSILIETSVDNMEQFNNAFLKTADYGVKEIQIDIGLIKGIIICDEEDTNDKDK